mgnify:CR=1 FL=1
MPLARWQRSFFKEKLNSLPYNISELTGGYLNFKSINKLVLEHLSAKKNHYQLIHSLMVFEQWRKRNSKFNFTI